MSFDETEGLFYKWQIWFDLFDMLKHPKYGTYTCLPSAGGLLDQPAKTMAVFEVMREEWLLKIQKDLKDSFKR